MEVQSIIINAGQEIKATILRSLVSRDISRAIIIGAIGSAVDLSVAAPIDREPPLKTTEVPYQVACEIVGMSGEIMPWEDVDPTLAAMYPGEKGPLFVHIHIAAAMMGGNVFGGGLRNGKAFRQIRVFIIAQSH